MSIYVYGTRLSYRDYLQAKSFEDGLRFEIDKQTRSIIASNEELQQEGLAIVKQLGDSVARGFEQLSLDIDSISSGIDELNSTFRWGFSEIIASLGHINDALNELILIAKTPSQIWACEQFDIARDAFRQGLYEDTLEYLNRAINGFGSNTGYKIEYRFHFLLGTVRIGSFKNNSSEIVNLVKAESAFLAAAKYARHDLPHEAGRALVAAGWAAYCQGKFTEAQEHTEQAISLYPDLAEAHFQLAKIAMHCNKSTKALPYLKNAIDLDRGYAIKCAADDDFRPYEESVNSLLKELYQNIQKKAGNALRELEKLLPKVGKCHVDYFSLNNYANIAPAEQALKQAQKANSNETYFGYLDVFKLCSQAKSDLRKALQKFVTQATQDVISKILSSEKRIPEIQKKERGPGWYGLTFLGILLSTIVGISRCSMVPLDYPGPGIVSKLTDGLGWSIFFFGSLSSILIIILIEKIQRRRKVINLRAENVRLRRIQAALGNEMDRWNF